MTPVENLLQRLEKVKGRNGSWTARCPAHADKGPSLAVREADDGRILVHCFAGCETANVLGAVGLDMTDLFPPDEKRKDYPVTGKPSMKPAFYASDLMRIIAFEALVVQIVAFDISEGKKISENDRQRMKVACERIEEAMRYANVN
jgi:hypothetical protein